MKEIVLGEKSVYEYTPNFICPHCKCKVFYHLLNEKQEHLKFCSTKLQCTYCGNDVNPKAGYHIHNGVAIAPKRVRI